MLNQARESARLCSALQFAKHQNEVLSLMPNSIQLMPNFKKQLNGLRRIESKGENICTQARSARREELADGDRRGRRQNCLSQIHNGDRRRVFLLTVAMEERRDGDEDSELIERLAASAGHGGAAPAGWTRRRDRRRGGHGP
jgi:hypothetical protein